MKFHLSFWPLIVFLAYLAYVSELSSGLVLQRRYKNPRNAPSLHCPRDERQIQALGRTCLRKCNTDDDCKSKKKKCLCDGVCGMSCIKPDKECTTLPDTQNGHVELTGVHTGAKAFYHCKPSYHVLGQDLRICQADGTWSGSAPKCQENIYCTGPPNVPHARHNATSKQTAFQLDTEVEYTCEPGYRFNGFGRARCFFFNGTTRWFGPDLTCEPELCDAPPDIINGKTVFDCTHYRCQLTYTCFNGFQLTGKNKVRVCEANGTWMPEEPPTCSPIQCPIPEDPANGRAQFTSVSFNSIVSYECKSEYMLKGEKTRRCTASKQWSGAVPYCKEIDCGSPGFLPNGWLENIDSGTQLGASVIFRCKEGMSFEGNGSATCQLDGTWTNPLPRCLAPCITPDVYFGTIDGYNVGDRVQHGETIYINCTDKYELSQTLDPSTCDNGTWTHIPKCLPARCKVLPTRPKHGMVIVPKSDHGMRALYKCKDGYQIEGQNITECRYGNWTAPPPSCVEIYCPFPGTLENGKVLLVGNMGLYDYRPYVKKITNNRQIMYECKERYVLGEGPSGATCLRGKWSPKVMPKCKLWTHPKWHRWIRSVDNVEKGEEHGDHRRRWEDLRKQRRRKGFRKKRPGPCEPIIVESYMALEVIRPGRDPNNTFSSGTRLKVSCGKGYGLNIGDRVAKCIRARWKPLKPECVTLPCRIPAAPNGMYTHVDRPMPERSTVRHGEMVKFSCLPGYNVQGTENLRCWFGGWSVVKYPECIPAPCELPPIDNGQYMSGYRDALTIAHDATVNYQCASDFVKTTTRPILCQLGELKPRNPSCIPGTDSSSPKPTESVSRVVVLRTTDERRVPVPDVIKNDGVSKPGWLKKQNCGPPAKTQNALVYKDGDLLKDEEKTFPYGTEIEFKCINSLLGQKNTWTIFCRDGSWIGISKNCEKTITTTVDPEIASLKREKQNGSCIFIKPVPDVMSFYEDKLITDKAVELPNGSVVLSRCNDIGKYSMTGSHRLVCESGEWKGISPSCTGLNQANDYALDKPPTILFRHQLGPIAQSNDGKLIVYPGTILHLECLWIRKFGTPTWNISHSYSNVRKYAIGWTTAEGRDPQLEYRLSIYHAVLNDTGTYGCVTPPRHRHAVEIVVKAVHCPVINEADHPELQFSTKATKLDTRVVFSCENGNALTGHDEIRCLPSGNWSSTVPQCQSIECPPLVNLTTPHLKVAVLSRAVGGRAVFSCPLGYGLRGAPEAICQKSGKWTQQFPYCKEVKCSTPSAPIHGYVQGNGEYKAGDVVQFSCETGYKMNGQPIIVCQENGRWSGSMPTCVQACTYPGTTIGGTISTVKFYYNIGERVLFDCTEGLKLHGESELRCLKNGKWSSTIPQCLAHAPNST